MSTQCVVIVGASDKPDRYAYKAMKSLLKEGHKVLLVHPRLKQIEGLPVLHDIADISASVDTITLYVGPAISANMGESLIALNPGRVIFNPGAENPELEAKLEEAGIHTLQACTLVLLSTKQF
ncbi:CoA-binding protein [soil metagenome]